jgi:hypothetical protein
MEDIMSVYTIKPLLLAKVASEKGPMTYLTYHGQPVFRPYVFWYIQADDKHVLVDTAIEAEDYKSYRTPFKNLPLEPVQTFEEALAKVNCDPDDIDIIIQTHLHMDHMYNTSKCRNALIYVQEEELTFALKPHVIFEIVYPAEIISKLEFKTLKGEETILPGISVLPVPGHSPGCQAVIVQTSEGKAVISGFCSIMENFDPSEDVKVKVSPFATYPVIAPGIHTDLFQAYDSALKVKEIADIIIPLHDMDLAREDQIPS